MSLFRKPIKKIQRRVFDVDDDEDGEPEPPPPPVISKQKKENKPVKTTALLSFADEEEDGEVFKVKKSSQSRRLAKKKDKEKRRGIENDNNTDKQPEEKANDKDEANDKPEPKKKKVTLEGLILSGREALAADGKGDVSDDEVQEAEEDEGGFHRYRAESVRAALAAGKDAIPDAALIHAARKTRQQARELGGDYVSIRSEETKPGSRLVRDDDDGSGDEDEGRLLVRGIDLPSDKPKRGTAAATPDEEMDSEGEQWEEQQMQKAMLASTDNNENGIEVNPFTLAPPPPPRLEDAPPHLRPLAAASADELIHALAQRLEDLKTARETSAQQREELKDRLLQALRIKESREARCKPLDEAYKRAQAARGYLTDLVECLDEKLPELEALEARALSLHRRRCEYLQERRRADTRDHAHDVLHPPSRSGAARRTDSEEKVRRVAEREGRRRARRLKREAAGAHAAHREGDSSDDDLPPEYLQHHNNEREQIQVSARALLADAAAAFSSVRGACARLRRVRARSPRLYADAYVGASLPRLLAPLVRHQLILWNPLADEDNEDYERMDWYKCLMMYGVRAEPVSSDSSASEAEEEEEAVSLSEEATRRDQDLLLVPTIVAEVLLPKLTELISAAWDPMCVRSCIRARTCVLRLCALPRARAGLRALAAALHARLQHALAHDVFLPLLPQNALEGAGGALWRRGLGAGARLLRSVLALCAPPLHADAHALQLLGTLCTAAGAAPAPYAASAAAALASTIPRESCALRTLALKRIAVLAQLALDRLQTDNPMHLKALEQVRAVISEARAAQ